jgi:hypothetical protein
MREPVTANVLQEFMRALAAAARTPSHVFLVGGATAVLLGWRTSTIDVDLKIVPESDELLRSIPALKERLHLNVELASPDDFIPELPGWQERSRFIQQEGKLAFYHYDFYAQALAKIERGHDIDSSDVDRMFTSALIEPQRLLELLSSIEDKIYRYPALNPVKFRQAVQQAIEKVRPRT